jgi:hypothetical protein
VGWASCTETLTALEWAADERHVVCGDGKGTVSVTPVRSSATAATATAASDSHKLQVAGGGVVQLARSAQGGRPTMVISTRTACWLLCVRTLTVTAVGSKPRDGAYGALFHPLAWAAAPLPHPPSASSSASDAPEWLLAARPGGRLWLVHTTHTKEADDTVTTVAAVKATLRLASLPPPQPLPWAPTTTAAAAAAAAAPMQFGRLLPLGPFVLSVSVRPLPIPCRLPLGDVVDALGIWSLPLLTAMRHCDAEGVCG